VGVSATGRPWFDSYHDISCADLTGAPTCANDSDCPNAFCLQKGIATGVCVAPSSSTSTLLISFDDGSCLAELTFEAQAKACCAKLSGFDCREWPYPHDGKPGQTCARHEDCEPGLLCKSGAGVDLTISPVHGTGICMCSEVDEHAPLPNCQ
jgi:hypothetical protein